MVTREQLIDWAIQNGWTLDQQAHLQKVEHQGLRRYRLMLGRIAVHYEIHTHAGWVRVRSGYFKDLTITVNGELVGWTGEKGVS